MFLHSNRYHACEKSTCKAFTYNISINVISKQHATILYELLYKFCNVSLSIVGYSSNLDNIINTGNVGNVGNFRDIVNFNNTGNLSNVGNFGNACKFSNIGIIILAVLTSGRWHKKLNIIIEFSNSIFIKFYFNAYLH